MNVPARLGLILCAVSLSACISPGEKAAGLDRAAAYFAAVGAEWKKQAPFEKHFGHFVGRRNVSRSWLAVSIDPSSNEFIVTLIHYFSLSERLITEARLSQDLRIIEMTEYDESQGEHIGREWEVHEGRIEWLFKPEGNAVQGDLHAGYMTGDLPMFLPFFVVPPAGEPASAPGLRGGGCFAYRLVETPRDFFVAGTKVHTKAIRLEGRWPDFRDEVFWIPLSEDGHALELQCAEGPGHIREVPAGDVGKDLDEPLRPLEPYEHPIYEMVMAAKKGDRDEVAKAFDFEKLAAEGVDHVLKLSAEEKEASIEKTKQALLDHFCGDAFRESIEWQVDLAEVLPACIRSSLDGDTARVAVTGRRGDTYVLRKAVGGPRDGKWLIQGTEPYKAR